MTKSMNEESAAGGEMVQTANNKVFVGGLSWNTSEAGLESVFSQAGEIVDLRIITDRETGRSKGFGFVTFGQSNEAEEAINLFNGKEIDGRVVRVNHAEEKPRRFNNNRPSGNGGYDRGNSRNGGNNRW